TRRRFLSLASTIATPVAIVFPRSSLSSKPENFAITPSLNSSFISAGALVLGTSAAGLADLSMGWALAGAAITVTAPNASVPLGILCRNISHSFLSLNTLGTLAAQHACAPTHGTVALVQDVAGVSRLGCHHNPQYTRKRGLA